MTNLQLYARITARMPSIRLLKVPHEVVQALARIVDAVANQEMPPAEAEERRKELLRPYLPYDWVEGDHGIIQAVKDKIISLPGEAV